MAEPKTRGEKIERLLPGLLHWSIVDERIGGFRSDSFAVKTLDGLMLIDPLPLEEKQQAGLDKVGAILLTHGNHQRSAWRLRRESGAPVYAPAGGREDARRLAALPLTVLCAAHAVPKLEGCRETLLELAKVGAQSTDTS